MNGFLSGQLTKSIVSKKRTLRFWNILFICMLTSVIIIISFPLMSLISDNTAYEVTQTYLGVENQTLKTEQCSYSIETANQCEVDIAAWSSQATIGQEISLYISCISSQVLEIRSNGKVVYKKATIPFVPIVALISVIAVPLISFSIFMLIILNAKKPGRLAEKIQKKYLLRFYK